MNWLDFLSLVGQAIFSFIIVAFGIGFIVYRIRYNWVKAQIDVLQECMQDQKKSQLMEAMTKK